MSGHCDEANGQTGHCDVRTALIGCRGGRGRASSAAWNYGTDQDDTSGVMGGKKGMEREIMRGQMC